MRSPTRRPAERGAVATLVAVLMATGVLLGFTAVAVDVGRVVLERRELQNGADAGALSLATSCAKGNCVQDADGLQNLVDANATDSQHDVVEQCGSVGSGLPACSSSSLADITKCPPLPPNSDGIDYVEVHTRSRSTSGGFIQNIFGAAAGGDANTVVDTCARAGWGPLGGASTLPLTFRTCEFDEAGFGPENETALPLKYDSVDVACDPDTVPSGGDFFGGFGWLENDDCVVTLETGDWAQTQTGVGGGSQCLSLLSPGDTIMIPVHDCISDSKTLCVPGDPSGNFTYYHIDSYQAFYITGIDITGQAQGSPSDAAQAECNDESQGGGNSPGKCLFGYFIEDYVSSDGDINPDGDPNSVKVVKPLG